MPGVLRSQYVFVFFFLSGEIKNTFYLSFFYFFFDVCKTIVDKYAKICFETRKKVFKNQ